MNIFDTKRGLHLAAMILGTSSMVAPSLHASTEAEENARYIIKNWHGFRINENGSRVDHIKPILKRSCISLAYQDEEGNTVVHVAAGNGDVAALKRIGGGAAYSIRNNNGQTPEEFARAKLRQILEDAQAYTENNEPIPPSITKWINAYEETIKFLERTKKYLPRRTDGMVGPWGHGR
jgi:hypothetical protein